MRNTMEWHLETLPDSGIWTGSADHMKMTAIKGSSLLGGMRFWTEALLRSFGYRVCDYIKDKEVFETRHPEKICAACHSFGCTGLSRVFSLHVTAEKMREYSEKKIIKVDAPGRNSSYYALAPGWQGKFTLSLACRRRISWPRAAREEQEQIMLPSEVLLATLLMLEYGTLGALDQYGCGLVRLLNRDELLPVLQDCSLPKDDDTDAAPGYADLRDFFFFKGRADQQELERRCRCTIKSKDPGQGVASSQAAMLRVRRLLRDTQRGQDEEKSVRHWLCGTMRPKAIGSHMSFGFSGETLYGWGWLPRRGIPELSGPKWASVREKALNAVYTCLQGFCSELKWKEFASLREAAAPKEWRAYVTEMIAQPWRDA